MDNSSVLPARPCLRAGVEVVSLDHDKVLLRSFSGTVMLSGEFVSSELPTLIRQCDGSKTIQELVESVDEGFRPELEKFLLLMVERNILYDGELPGTQARDDGLLKMNSHERAYWSLYAPTSADASDRLRSSTVVVSSLGGVGVSVARALAASGVGKLVLVDPHRVRQADELFGYGSDCIGKPRAEVVAAELSEQKCKNVMPVVADVDGAPNWDDLVSEATLVVLAGENMALAGYDRTNEACIRHKTRWVSARIDRTRGVIGPFIVPEQTACFTCFELRNRANADHPGDHEVTYHHWKHTGGYPDSWPTMAPFVNMVGSYVALDIQRVLAGHHLSAFLGRVLYLDLHTFESRFHEILKLPRCPACSRARERPLTRIWDIRPKAAARASD